MCNASKAVDKILNAALGGEGWLARLDDAPEEIQERLAQRVVDRHEWAAATEDFITLILQTRLIDDEEDFLRLEILRCLQFMPARYLDVAMHGADQGFRELDRKHEQFPAYLILDYLRRTRATRSATSESRDRFLDYPHSPAGENIPLFEQLIKRFRGHLADRATSGPR